MKSTKELPEGYSEIFSVDLSKNKRQAIFVNVLALVIAVAMIVPAIIFVSIPELDIGAFLIRASVALVGIFVYIILHELTHGLFMVLFGCKKPKYGFGGLYAYARADFYFSKLAYVTIALAPVVIFGALFAVLSIAIPASWFYTVYVLQVVNISGAAGDIYVTAKFMLLPRDILVFDTGTAMTVYSREK